MFIQSFTPMLKLLPIKIIEHTMPGRITILYFQSMQSWNADMQAKRTFHGINPDERQKKHPPARMPLM